MQKIAGAYVHTYDTEHWKWYLKSVLSRFEREIYPFSGSFEVYESLKSRSMPLEDVISFGHRQ